MGDVTEEVTDSDYRLITFDISICATQLKKLHRKRYNVQKADWKSFIKT